MRKMRFYLLLLKNSVVLSTMSAVPISLISFSHVWKVYVRLRKLWLEIKFNNALIQAVESASKIAAVLPQKHLEEFYIPMLKRLASGDWFTSRTSACGLFAAGYSGSTAPVQDELLKFDVAFNFRLYAVLASDDTPMVKRASAAQLCVSAYLIKKLIKVVPKPVVLTEILPIYFVLAKDDQVIISIDSGFCEITYGRVFNHHCRNVDPCRKLDSASSICPYILW
jgi:hypothetical protein